jgi:hypothetical protein
MGGINIGALGEYRERISAHWPSAGKKLKVQKSWRIQNRYLRVSIRNLYGFVQ